MCGYVVQGSERWKRASNWSWGFECGPSWGFVAISDWARSKTGNRGPHLSIKWGIIIILGPQMRDFRGYLYVPIRISKCVLSLRLHCTLAPEIRNMVGPPDTWRNKIRFGICHLPAFWPLPPVSSPPSVSCYKDPASRVSKGKPNWIPNSHHLQSQCAEELQPYLWNQNSAGNRTVNSVFTDKRWRTSLKMPEAQS